MSTKGPREIKFTFADGRSIRLYAGKATQLEGVALSAAVCLNNQRVYKPKDIITSGVTTLGGDIEAFGGIASRTEVAKKKYQEEYEEKVKKLNYPQLLVDWPDFGIPRWTKEDWLALVEDLKKLSETGLVGLCCVGGHGRTGTALSIFYGLCGAEGDPVEWVRKNYCEKVVESAAQIEYIQQITGAEVKAKPAKGFTQTSGYLGGYDWREQRGEYGSGYKDWRNSWGLGTAGDYDDGPLDRRVDPLSGGKQTFTETKEETTPARFIDVSEGGKLALKVWLEQPPHEVEVVCVVTHKEWICPKGLKEWVGDNRYPVRG